MIGQPGASVPAVLKRIGNSYRIVIDARAAASAQTTPVRIALTFDRFLCRTSSASIPTRASSFFGLP